MGKESQSRETEKKKGWVKLSTKESKRKDKNKKRETQTETPCGPSSGTQAGTPVGTPAWTPEHRKIPNEHRTRHWPNTNKHNQNEVKTIIANQHKNECKKSNNP